MFCLFTCDVCFQILKNVKNLPLKRSRCHRLQCLSPNNSYLLYNVLACLPWPFQHCILKLCVHFNHYYNDPILSIISPGCVLWPCSFLSGWTDVCQHYVRAPHDVTVDFVADQNPKYDTIVVSWQPASLVRANISHKHFLLIINHILQNQCSGHYNWLFKVHKTH